MQRSGQFKEEMVLKPALQPIINRSPVTKNFVDDSNKDNPNKLGNDKEDLLRESLGSGLEKSENYEKMRVELNNLKNKINGLEQKLTELSLSATKNKKESVRINHANTANISNVSEMSSVSAENKSLKKRKNKSKYKKNFYSKSRKNMSNLSAKSHEINIEKSKNDLKINDKYLNIVEEIVNLKRDLIKEKNKKNDLKKLIDKLEMDQKRNVYEELKELKEEYDQLKQSFEKSEYIRKRQKVIIEELQNELSELKEIDRPKTKIKPKKVNAKNS